MGDDIQERSLIMTLPNGVAAGDVTTTSAVLWTRSLATGNVIFTVATDASFSQVVATETVAVTDTQVPVKVDLDGLSAATQYYYQVTNAAGDTETGQFRTPAIATNYTGLRFGVSGDWQGELAPYPAIANADGQDLAFFVQMGDTVEADSESAALPGVTQAQTLAEFRIKHAEIYTERFGVNNWADLRAATAVYATWDDHELTNDFAGGAAPADSPQRNNIFGDATTGFVNDTQAFDDALRAFQDYKPIRDEFYGDTGDDRTANEQQLYRYNTFGLDAATYVLDVRSFRDAPLPFILEAAPDEAIQAYLESAFEPGRTMLGQAQLEQFKQDLLAAEAEGITWKFVMSTVPMQNFGVPVAGERWEGYAAERAELLGFIEENDIDNVVFVTGDFHGNVVNNVTYQEAFGGPQIQTDVIDIMVGPVGIQLTVPFLPAPFNETFAAPFGPATVGFTPASLLAAQGKSQADYLALTDDAARDQFVREVLDARLTPLGFDPVGLEGSGIDATLLQGEYIAAHNYGWTEFDIDPLTQELTVTTYGVEPYTEADLLADPAIASRTPVIVSQFTVRPTLAPPFAAAPPRIRFRQGEPGDRLQGDEGRNRLQGTDNNDVLKGRQGNDRLIGEDGDDRLDGNEGNDLLKGGKANDRLRGQDGRDRILGQQGNDVLIGGEGNDVLNGGRGADVFVYESVDDGRDRILRFNPDEDLIDLSQIFADDAFAGINDIQRFNQSVSLVETNRGTRLVVDRDGSGPSSDTAVLAIVEDVSGLGIQNFVIS
ncbi:MAG: alkaline phosphatase D family protein [Synechococcales bacterium]|nr:alkaline phosphatase D family protein [Synechococcales bacterium]